MSDTIELARYYDENEGKIVSITIADYNNFIKNKNKEKIADFIYNRLHSRYIKPFEYKDDKNIYQTQYKNGFSMMASYCLLVETLQSFKNGWGDSDRKSGQAFKEFFQDNEDFSTLKNKGKEIYSHVRCGILHQGETTGGWKIRRDGDKLEENNAINVFKFGKALEKSLENYKKKLKSEEWDSEMWDNFRTKMRKIIQNCE